MLIITRNKNDNNHNSLDRTNNRNDHRNNRNDHTNNRNNNSDTHPRIVSSNIHLLASCNYINRHRLNSSRNSNINNSIHINNGINNVLPTILEATEEENDRWIKRWRVTPKRKAAKPKGRTRTRTDANPVKTPRWECDT